MYKTFTLLLYLQQHYISFLVQLYIYHWLFYGASNNKTGFCKHKYRKSILQKSPLKLFILAALNREHSSHAQGNIYEPLSLTCTNTSYIKSHLLAKPWAFPNHDWLTGAESCCLILHIWRHMYSATDSIGYSHQVLLRLHSSLSWFSCRALSAIPPAIPTLHQRSIQLCGLGLLASGTQNNMISIIPKKQLIPRTCHQEKTKNKTYNTDDRRKKKLKKYRINK